MDIFIQVGCVVAVLIAAWKAARALYFDEDTAHFSMLRLLGVLCIVNVLLFVIYGNKYLLFFSQYG